MILWVESISKHLSQQVYHVATYLNAAGFSVKVGGVPKQGLRQSQLRRRQLVPVKEKS